MEESESRKRPHTPKRRPKSDARSAARTQDGADARGAHPGLSRATAGSRFAPARVASCAAGPEAGDSDLAAYAFALTRRVEFSETDMAGIMHFSNFFRYMEAAEHAYLRSLGFSVDLHGIAPGLCLPRVHARCDYRTPLRFEDEVVIRLRVARKTARSIDYRFRFERREGKRTREVAQGMLTVVCARRQANGSLKAALLPKVLADRIHVAPQARRNPRHP